MTLRLDHQRIEGTLHPLMITGTALRPLRVRAIADDVGFVQTPIYRIHLQPRIERAQSAASTIRPVTTTVSPAGQNPIPRRNSRLARASRNGLTSANGSTSARRWRTRRSLSPSAPPGDRTSPQRPRPKGQKTLPATASRKPMPWSTALASAAGSTSLK